MLNRKSTAWPIDHCCLLVVYSSDIVLEACRGVGKFLEWRSEQVPATERSPASPIIGIWNQSAPTNLPCEPLGHELKSTQRVFQFRESMGINGKWSLLWFDVSAVADSTICETLRESLLISLTNNLSNPGPRFTPVFDPDEMPDAIRKETSRLDQQFSKLVMPALTCDTKKGALFPVSVLMDSNG